MVTTLGTGAVAGCGDCTLGSGASTVVLVGDLVLFVVSVVVGSNTKQGGACGVAVTPVLGPQEAVAVVVVLCLVVLAKISVGCWS